MAERADHVVHSGSEEDIGGRRAPDDEVIGRRHAPGTWKMWEGTWFYATKTPGFTDVKCHMKAPFRNVTSGMGIAGMSKALTPHHYGDDWNDPWRTMLLLRAWCIWRGRLHGWARAKECRQREIDRQVGGLEADLRRAQSGQPAKPLLGSEAAHRLLAKWVPGIVGSLAP